MTALGGDRFFAIFSFSFQCVFVDDELKNPFARRMVGGTYQEGGEMTEVGWRCRDRSDRDRTLIGAAISSSCLYWRFTKFRCGSSC